MKAIAINGSPRKNWNTAALLNAALDGAREAGAETELVSLYDLDYSGCVSCFACKRKGAERCRCYHQDGLSGVLERVLSSDVLLLGSPVYFGDVTGKMRCFIERLAFITLSYDDPMETIFPGHIDTAFFFTMNMQTEQAQMYKPMIKSTLGALSRLGGSVEQYLCTDTLQFDDYSKYHAAKFSEQAKRARRAEQFPHDLEVKPGLSPAALPRGRTGWRRGGVEAFPQASPTSGGIGGALLRPRGTGGVLFWPGRRRLWLRAGRPS